MVSDYDVGRAVNKLRAAGFTVPAGVSELDLARGWRHVLGGISSAELHRAVDGYLRSDRTYWPKPGQLLAVLEADPHRAVAAIDSPRGWDQTHEGPCPVCGAVLQLLTARQAHPDTADLVWDRGRMRQRTSEDREQPQRYGVLHDRARHAEAGVPCVGAWR